jgi:hypothetical protein
MKPSPQPGPGAKLALALTWDGARWPVRSLPPKARAFLGAKGRAIPSPREAARLFAEEKVGELRICWVPRLQGGGPGLADIFPAPKGRRVPFRAVKMTPLGDILGVIYRRVIT